MAEESGAFQSDVTGAFRGGPLTWNDDSGRASQFEATVSDERYRPTHPGTERTEVSSGTGYRLLLMPLHRRLSRIFRREKDAS